MSHPSRGSARRIGIEIFIGNCEVSCDWKGQMLRVVTVLCQVTVEAGGKIVSYSNSTELIANPRVAQHQQRTPRPQGRFNITSSNTLAATCSQMIMVSRYPKPSIRWSAGHEYFGS
jgi:hypothetical protein